MTAELMARLGGVADNRWGLVTTARAEEAGISRKQMSRLATGGFVVRVAQGVYRIEGATPARQEEVAARWIVLATAGEPPAPGVPSVVAAGESAALLHGIGGFRFAGSEFIVPARRRTRLTGVRLRVQKLTPYEVTMVEEVPALTVERTIADLLATGSSLHVVGRVVRDAVEQEKLSSPERLAQYLAPQATAQGMPLGDGRALRELLFDIAGVPEARRTSSWKAFSPN
jgi:predicted transcriptional regulator of viral defense system